MRAVKRLRVRCDGEEMVVTCRHGHWLPRLLGYSGVAVGTTVYFALLPSETSARLLGHELIHVLDFVRVRRRWRWHWLAVAVDLARYAWAWARVGFRYRQIPEEIVAYRDESRVAYGAHPDVQVLGVLP